MPRAVEGRDLDEEPTARRAPDGGGGAGGSQAGLQEGDAAPAARGAEDAARELGCAAPEGASKVQRGMPEQEGRGRRGKVVAVQGGEDEGRGGRGAVGGQEEGVAAAPEGRGACEEREGEAREEPEKVPEAPGLRPHCQQLRGGSRGGLPHQDLQRHRGPSSCSSCSSCSSSCSCCCC